MCKGKKVTKDKKILQVYIDKGMKHGQKIVFAGEADEAPGLEPGDIIFVVTEKKHEMFKRNGNDLYLEFNLLLVEALCGFTLTITHLDDRSLVIKSASGEVVTPGEIRLIQNEGMPLYKKPYEKGNMYVQFNVEFPKPGYLKPQQLKDLEKLLPPRRATPKILEDMEEVKLEQFNQNEFKQRQKASGRSNYEEDNEGEDGAQGGQRVQCAQQ